MDIIEYLKRKYWELPILNEKQKDEIFYSIRGCLKGRFQTTINENINSCYVTDYIQQILNIQNLNNDFSINYPVKCEKFLKNNDIKLIAYYLPQYYPNQYNNKWWGRGSTEWNNVSKSMPQYVGQYQPRLPGELGYYDLRIQDNIYRQIELAEIYGIYGFCFYYYWFDGIRLLDLPVENYVKDKNIKFPFCICWVNANWRRLWSSTSQAVLMQMNNSTESYKKFIESCYKLFEKENYIKINNKPVLIIYKPFDIPNREEVLDYWRDYVKEKLNMDLYIIASFAEQNLFENISEVTGFDVMSEFAPGPYLKYMNDISDNKYYVCDNFYGNVYDYKEFVENKKYFKISKKRKVIKAIVPMWDNTARRKNKGTILDGATPELYKQWLKDIIVDTKDNSNLDDNIIFINAWNEWAEGTYLEPDLKWQYGYLEATKQAIIETR